MTLERPLVFSLSLFVSIAVMAAPPSGAVTTIAGTPGVAGYWDGPASDAMFTHPTWLDVVVGNTHQPTCDLGSTGEIFVVDRGNQRVRHVAADGFVSTFGVKNHPLDFGGAFGGGIFVEQPGTGCGCGIYSRGVFIAATGADEIALASMDGQLASRDDWNPVLGGLHRPTGIARALNVGPNPYSTWRLYVTDSANHTILISTYRLSGEGCPQTVGFSVLAGAPGQPGSADGKGSAARFNTPRGIAALPDGTLYVTDAGNHTVRRVDPDGNVTTVAGVAGVAGSDDGPALQAHLNTPSGIDVNDKGEVFIVDTFSHTIRMLKDGMLTTIAGTPGVSGFADGDAATAKFNAPVGLKIAPDGSLIIADTGNNVIRRLTR